MAIMPFRFVLVLARWARIAFRLANQVIVRANGTLKTRRACGDVVFANGAVTAGSGSRCRELATRTRRTDRCVIRSTVCARVAFNTFSSADFVHCLPGEATGIEMGAEDKAASCACALPLGVLGDATRVRTTSTF